MPGGVHVVADVAQQRLDPGGAEDRVVDVVLVGRRQVAVVAVARLLVGVVEDDELQLGAGQRDQPVLGGPVELALQDRARRLQRPAAPSSQTRSHCTIAVAGQVGEQPDGVQSSTNSMSP